MLGKCDRLRKELSRAYSAIPLNRGYIRRLADEINAIERAIAAPQCLGSVQLSASLDVLDDETFDRTRMDPRMSNEALAQTVVGCESKDRRLQHA
jgi:hypothetical protein